MIKNRKHHQSKLAAVNCLCSFHLAQLGGGGGGGGVCVCVCVCVCGGGGGWLGYERHRAYTFGLPVFPWRTQRHLLSHPLFMNSFYC